MGRNVSVNTPSVQLTAGAAISLNDAVQLAVDGKAFPVVCADHAAVANLGSVAATLAPGANTQYVTYGRPPAYRDPATGNEFLVTADSTSYTNTRISKYAPNGKLLSSIVLSISTLYQPQIQALSNGNLLITAEAAISNLYFAILDTNLNTVKAATLISATAYAYYDALALSGGGFMVSYVTAGAQKLVVYDNAGNVTTAATTVQTWTGTAAQVTAKLVELSNLNVALVCTSGYSTTIGTYLGIFTAAGAQVQAMTNIDTGWWVGQYYPEVSYIAGFLCIEWATSGTTMKLGVYSDAGALQGSQQTITTYSSMTAQACTKIVNDGTSFYLLWAPVSGAGNWNITKITTAGAITTYTGAGGALPNNSGWTIDAVIDNGKLIAAQSNNMAGYFFVVSLATMTTDVANTASVIGNYVKVLAVGDGTILVVVVDGTNAWGKAQAIKYTNTAIIGIAQAAAAQGASVNLATLAGAYIVNAIKGSSVKAFDHSATNVYGNKGTLLTNGVVLKGL